MTTTEFHNALLQGRGRCVQAVREDPEKYREEVLWACRELVSFDTQCEGSKAWFIREMVRCYDDPEPFVQAACDALRECPSDGGWRLFCLAELLEWFFRDGHIAAWRALMDKYRQLYHELLHVGPPEDCFIWSAKGDYDGLCVILSWCRDHYLEIARDIGRLFVETEWSDGWDFAWLYHTKGDRYRKALERAAERDEYVAAYIRVHEEAVRESEAQMRERKRTRLPRRDADPEEISRAVERYLAAETTEERAAALDAFWVCPYPGEPGPVISDACSENEGLRDAAWRVLAHTQHPDVRSFALEMLEREDDAFGVLAANYREADEERLMARLRAEPVDFACNTWWHRYQLDVLNMKKQPKAALQYIFDATYCSCCREHALSMMGKRRMLTRELLEECVFDSSDDIRSYARRALRRRKR